MNILKSISLSLLCIAVPVFGDDTAPSPVAADPAVEALPILQASYADFSVLKYQPGDKLDDLIARSDGGLSLVSPAHSAPTPIITAILPGGVTYWRLASFTPKTSWAELAAQWKASASNDSSGVIVDLRSNEAPQDMRGAAQVMGFFAPADTTFARYLPPENDGTKASPPDVPFKPSFRGPLVVLVDQHTSGAAEALAARLQTDGALTIGTPTAGKAAVFGESTLASGQILRFVADHLHAPDGSDLWHHPLNPDITIALTDHNEKAALTLIRDNQIQDVIQESAQRHRLSEASLVQGQDPEYDDYLSSLEKHPVLLSLPVIHDTVLITALDSLKAIQLSQRALPAKATTSASASTSTSVQ
jgi:hypothetical protein